MFEKRLQILIDEPRYRRLAAAARERRQSVSSVIREAIDVALPADLAEKQAAADAILAAEPGRRIAFCDFHAEATSEKIAMGWYLDGRVSAVVGTHTHVPTADNRVLPGGTAYCTDAGMVGPRDGVIGMDREPVLRRFLTGVPQKWRIADGAVTFNSVLINIDRLSGQATSIQRIDLVHT